MDIVSEILNKEPAVRPQIVIHGGVVETLSRNYESALATLEECCREAWSLLGDGWQSVDVVERVVERLERSGNFLAGRGACPNAAGEFELDASIMVGQNGRGAGVAAAKNAYSAIPLARRVMDRTPHVLIAGSGVDKLVENRDSFFASDPHAYFQPTFTEEESERSGTLAFGTVGAAVMDCFGDFAAGTATAGVLRKMPGRVGDTAVLGAGTWASKSVAVSCTGQGEYFLRKTAAAQVEYRCQWQHASIAAACHAVIADIESVGGRGGLIAASSGGVCWSFNTTGLKRAWVNDFGAVQVALA